MRKHYKITDVDALETIVRIAHGPASGFGVKQFPYHPTPGALWAWVLKHGPIRLRMRARTHMAADRTRGVLSVSGANERTITAVITGYDSDQGFRVLFPFGPAWGHAGKAWIPVALMRDILRQEDTRVVGVKVKDLAP